MGGKLSSPHLSGRVCSRVECEIARRSLHASQEFSVWGGWMGSRLAGDCKHMLRAYRYLGTLLFTNRRGSCLDRGGLVRIPLQYFASQRTISECSSAAIESRVSAGPILRAWADGEKLGTPTICFTSYCCHIVGGLLVGKWRLHAS
jgi:hypothetical protein